MLAVMSYSIELLLCAALGYALGHSLFDSKKQSYLKVKSSLNVLNSNPCHLDFGDEIGVKVDNKIKFEENNGAHIQDLGTDHEMMGLLSRRTGTVL